MSACSSSPGPTLTASPTPPLTSLTGDAGWGYTLFSPATRITASYAILKVVGPGDVTISSITVNSRTTLQAMDASSFEAIHDTGAALETYILGFSSLSAAKGVGIVAASSLQKAVPSQGSLAAWRSAPTAAKTVLHPGSYYVLTYCFTIPQPALSWALQGATLTYTSNGGSPQTLTLHVPSVEISPTPEPTG